MHPVDVIVTSPESAQDGVAEFSVAGRLFAYTVLEDDELIIRLVLGDADDPVVVGARSLWEALERARELLS
jgi:hypothetical protein